MSDKWERRDAKRRPRMKLHGRSVLVIVAVIGRKSALARKLGVKR